ncbi:MAG: hypothetical protein HYY52_09005 [Candidatus Melainabacteria bacterium]|nr:hypothetical protein [Candidatus Melainabacteria bacterium]
MSESEPMRQIHKIRHKIYDEIKHMSTDEQLKYFHKKAEQFEKEMGNIKLAKDLKSFFANLRKQQAS